MSIEIDIATEFSYASIGRYEAVSDSSGEAFRRKLLLPRFRQARESGSTLLINMEGMKSLCSSFLEEGFGGLVRETQESASTVLRVLRFAPEGTHYDPYIADAKNYIREAGLRLAD